MKLIKTNGDTTELKITSKSYSEADLFQLGVHKSDLQQASDLMRNYIKNADIDKSKYHLKILKNDNALLFYRKSNISQNDDYLCYGVFIQFNVVRENDIKQQVCDVKLIEGQSKYFEDMKCIYSMRYQYHYASKGNIECFQKNEQYERGLIDLWETIVDDCRIYEKDTACYIKNYYLLLEKIAVKPNLLYETYDKLKKLDYVAKASYDNATKGVNCKLSNGKNVRINIVGGDMYEINSYILNSYEQMIQSLELIRDDKLFMPLNFMGANAPIVEYSKSKNINDLIDPELRRKNFNQDTFITVDNEHQNDLVL